MRIKNVLYLSMNILHAQYLFLTNNMHINIAYAITGLMLQHASALQHNLQGVTASLILQA